MAFEVSCGQCEGRLMVEQGGVVVACPHCGAHLSVGEAPETPQAETPAAETDASPQTNTEPPAAASEQAATAEAPATDAAPTETPSEPATEQPAEIAPTGIPEIAGEQMPFIPDATVPVSEAAAPITEPSNPVTPTEAGEAVTALPQSLPTEPVAAAPAELPAEHAPAAQTPDATVVAPGGPDQNFAPVRPAKTVPHKHFTLLRSYALAATVAVVILLYKVMNPTLSNLESLPDIKPPKNPKDKDQIVYKLVPEDAALPPGHVLSLGQAQRFGNLMVTPTKVTRGPIEFEHHLGDTSVAREPGPDVVKLWFEFENVSTDQEISPLDGLLFKRDDSDFESIRSNNFVCRQSEKKKGGELVFVYDLNEFDVWNLKDQNADYEIPPGEKLETYIPTTEDGLSAITSSDEPLVWRLHFRKGYSPKNYGVTTVIEVAFESSDIVADGASKSARPESNKEESA